MLYVFYGEPKQVTEKVESTIASLLAKSTDAHVVRVEEGMVVDGSNALLELLAEQGLFKANYIVYINARSSDLLRAWVQEEHNLQALATSHHLALLALEGMADKEKQRIEHVAEKIQECKEPEETRRKTEERRERVPKRDPFAITDALLQKKKQALFIELEHARLSGAAGEEVVGTLFWAAKTMVLAGGAKSATEVGLKDYPYRKALQGVHVWGTTGAEELLYTLATAPSRAYASGEDIYALLERELCG